MLLELKAKHLAAVLAPEGRTCTPEESQAMLSEFYSEHREIGVFFHAMFPYDKFHNGVRIGVIAAMKALRAGLEEAELKALYELEPEGSAQ